MKETEREERDGCRTPN